MGLGRTKDIRKATCSCDLEKPNSMALIPHSVQLCNSMFAGEMERTVLEGL